MKINTSPAASYCRNARLLSVMATLFLLLIFIPGGFAQSLTMNDLFILCKKSDINFLNDNLNKKGWEYYTNKVEDSHISKITWTFNKSPYDDKAQGWLHVFTYDNLPGKTVYSFFSNQSFNIVVSSISLAGLKQMNIEILEKKINTTYANTEFLVTLSTSKRVDEENTYLENTVTAYIATVIKKESEFDQDNGLKKTFDVYGNPESEYLLKDGIKNGIFRSFYPNGQVREVCHYTNGGKQGISKEFDEEGQQTGELTYQNDELTGPYKQFENGTLILAGELDKGVKSGQFAAYNSSGLREKEYQMKAGVLEGVYEEFHYNGGLLVEKITGFYSGSKKTGLWYTYLLRDSIPVELEFDTYVDDHKQGLFKRSGPDSLVFGTWNNQVYEGPFRIYKRSSNPDKKEIITDTSHCYLAAAGNYRAGMKHGNWKYYFSSKNLNKEGEYKNDVMTGEWKSYFDVFTDNNGNPLPCSGMWYLTETFENGKKQGKETRFIEVKTKDHPCDFIYNETFHPYDTCHWTYRKVFQITTYKNNEINGPFEERDSAGNIISQGNMINQDKDGLWKESDLKRDLNGKPIYLFHQGNYLNGLKSGIWTEFTTANQKLAAYQYEKGQLNGKTVLYNELQQPFEEKFYREGTLEKILCYDPTPNTVIAMFDKITVTDGGARCRKTDYHQRGKFLQYYTLRKPDDGQKVLHAETVLQYYRNLKFAGPGVFPDGVYQAFDTIDRIIEEGNLIKEKKTGTWKHYYYDVNVFTVQDFSTDSLQPEKYFEWDSQKPFSGKFVQKYENGEAKFEIKVDDGQRDGKSKYYNEKGDLIKSEKYDKGMLKK